MMSPPAPSARSRQRIEPQVIRTIGTVLLAAFLVVMVVSVTTIARHGTEVYVFVMLTLVISLLALMAASVLTGWLLVRTQPGPVEETGPGSEVKRLRDEVRVQEDMLVKLRGESALAAAARPPDRRVTP
jgi:hypothetical protein